MMELFICKMSLQNKRKCNFLKEAADYFLQDPSNLDDDIRQRLKIGPTGPYTQVDTMYLYIGAKICTNILFIQFYV